MASSYQEFIQAAVFPAMGFPVTFAQSNIIAVIFTVASVIRCYVWRRAFNRCMGRA